MITHGELFAGIGGFGVGMERAGIETKWHVEWDVSCQNVLRRHFPNVQIEGDVCDVGGHNLSPVDVISFGSPCQDLSIAGKRKGLKNGTRSSLFFEAIRIVRELNPKVAIWENVPGALSSNGGQDFRAVLAEMLRADVPMPRSGRWAAAGVVRSGEVEVAWRILDAQYFGVPQRRRRVFVVASFGIECAAEILFEPESLPRNTPPSRETGKGIADTFTIRSGKEGGGKGYLGQESLAMTLGGQPQYLSHAVMASGEDITGTLDASYGEKWGLGDQEAFRGTHHVLDDQGGSQMSTSENIVPTLRASVHGHQPLIAYGIDSEQNVSKDFMGTLRSHQSGGNEQAVAREMQHASEAYRETQGGIAPTLQSRMGTGGNNVPLIGIRRLTPLECERLQGFPDGWTDGQSDSTRYKQLGNAVAVPVVEWIGKRVSEALT